MRSTRGSSTPARRARPPHRNWYVWADPKPTAHRPTTGSRSFGGPAWTLDEATGQYYLHNICAEQPDLNWWDDEVRAAFDGIMRFWLDRGVAGFRIDVCHMIVKDALLRDNPPATDADPSRTSSSASARSTTPTGPRSTRSSGTGAACRRVPGERAPGRDAGRADGGTGPYYGNGGTSSTWPSTSRSSARPRSRDPPPDRRGHRGVPARRGLAGLDRIEP